MLGEAQEEGFEGVLDENGACWFFLSDMVARVLQLPDEKGNIILDIGFL